MAKDLIIRAVRMAGGIEMLELTSPYDPEMVKVAHALAGKWNMTTKKWYFSPDKLSELGAECLRIYGYPPGLSTGMNSDLVINTSLEAALEYVSAIAALAPELSDEEKDEVFGKLLDVLQ